MRLKRVKHFIFISILSLLTIFVSCNDRGIDIPNTPLAGTVQAEDWEFKFGNAYLYSGGQIPKYTYRLLSVDEFGDDPCPVVSTSNAHIRMVLPLGSGSYSIPFPQFEETVKFDFGNATVFSATSGFVEIFGVSQNQLVGYIEALLDDGNEVRGRFVIEIC